MSLFTSEMKKKHKNSIRHCIMIISKLEIALYLNIIYIYNSVDMDPSGSVFVVTYNVQSMMCASGKIQYCLRAVYF